MMGIRRANVVVMQCETCPVSEMTYWEGPCDDLESIAYRRGWYQGAGNTLICPSCVDATNRVGRIMRQAS